ncbi:MAG TPA: methylated-DNA--[protein]-cysteine S-methyltransferase [Chitinophagales bacterium]|nr:methylated-DNA--[protein]-cysteine S-methyltransferase [Chitinophagales bacterium]
MAEEFASYLTSIVGEIEIIANETHILQIEFLNEKKTEKRLQENAITQQARQQLTAYFEKKRFDFDLPLFFSGTEFQNKVWRQLQTIPYGKTISYLQLATQLGDPKCIRAAGTANGKNPFSIIVPCHRVIGSNGKLIGYAGGLWRKQLLLEHEDAIKRQISLEM